MKSFFCFVITFWIVFSTLFCELHPSIPAGDSGEFLAIAASNIGNGTSLLSSPLQLFQNTKFLLAHPPGYGLYCFFLANIWGPFAVPAVASVLQHSKYYNNNPNASLSSFLLSLLPKPVVSILDVSFRHGSLILMRMIKKIVLSQEQQAQVDANIENSDLYHYSLYNELLLPIWHGGDRSESSSDFYLLFERNEIHECLRKINGAFTGYHTKNPSSRVSLDDSCDVLFKGLHASSLFFASLSAAILCLAVLKMSPSSPSFGSCIVAICTGALTAVAAEPTRRYATEVEVFAMHQAIVALGCYCLSLLKSTSSTSPSSFSFYYFLSGICLGLGFGHQHSLLFLVFPTLIFELVRGVVYAPLTRFRVAKFLFGFLAGAAPSVVYTHLSLLTQQEESSSFSFVFGASENNPFNNKGETASSLPQSFGNTLNHLLRKYYGTFQMTSSSSGAFLDQDPSTFLQSFCLRAALHCSWLWNSLIDVPFAAAATIATSLPGHNQMMVLVAVACIFLVFILIISTRTRMESVNPVASNTNSNNNDQTSRTSLVVSGFSTTIIISLTFANVVSSVVLFAIFTAFSSSTSLLSLVDLQVAERFWLQSIPPIMFAVGSMICSELLEPNENTTGTSRIKEMLRLGVCAVSAAVIFLWFIISLSLISVDSMNDNIADTTTTSTTATSSSKIDKLQNQRKGTIGQFSLDIVQEALASSALTSSSTTTPVTILLTRGDITFAPLLALTSLSMQMSISTTAHEESQGKKGSNDPTMIWIDTQLASNRWFRQNFILRGQVRKNAAIFELFNSALEESYSTEGSFFDFDDFAHRILLGNVRHNVHIVSLLSPDTLPFYAKIQRGGKISIEAVDGEIPLHRFSLITSSKNYNNKNNVASHDDDDDDDETEERTSDHSRKKTNFAQVYLADIIKKKTEERIDREETRDDDDGDEEEHDENDQKGKKEFRHLNDDNINVLLSHYLHRSFSSFFPGQASSTTTCAISYCNAKFALSSFERIARNVNNGAWRKMRRFFSLTRDGRENHIKKSPAVTFAWDVDLNKLCAIGAHNSLEKMLRDIVVPEEAQSNENRLLRRQILEHKQKESVRREIALQLYRDVYLSVMLLTRNASDSRTTEKGSNNVASSAISLLSSSDREEITQPFLNGKLMKMIMSSDRNNVLVIEKAAGHRKREGSTSSGSKSQKHFGDW